MARTGAKLAGGYILNKKEKIDIKKINANQLKAKRKMRKFLNRNCHFKFGNGLASQIIFSPSCKLKYPIKYFLMKCIYIGNRDAGLYGEAITSDFILTEAANFLFKKVGRADALEAGRTMMEGYKIVHVDEMLFTEAWNRFAELKPFSLTDCTNLAVIENYGIGTLFTFDSAFKNFVKTVGI